MNLRRFRRIGSSPWFWSSALLVTLVVACGGGGSGSQSSTGGTSSTSGSSSTASGSASSGGSSGSSSTGTASLSLLAQAGKAIFFDTSLSASGKMSCASCHDPNHAYGPPNALAVQLGGATLSASGNRAVPSLTYRLYTPPYADLQVNPDGVSAPGPGGGFMWDGRANTLGEQAALPLLNSVEMANASADAVVAKVQAASYAALFRSAFGANVFANTATAFADVGAALQAFQVEDPSFFPYSSKYDAYYPVNRVGGSLTAAELRGMQVFSDPKTGNCAACHLQTNGLFTDFTYEAVGVPRNAAIPANAVSSFFDMGICGPIRTDHLPASAAAPSSFCGLFKTPSLRNVATRSVFFHNGVITSLEQAVRFYNTRDTNPEIWYPTVGGTALAQPSASFPTYGLITTQYRGGTVQKFNDLPAAYQSNIDKQLPLDGRAPGSTPPMSEQNIADLLCFLKTLTDGYTPPATPPTSGPCIN